MMGRGRGRGRQVCLLPSRNIHCRAGTDTPCQWLVGAQQAGGSSWSACSLQMDGAATPAASHSGCTRPLHSCTAQPRQLAVPPQILDPACQNAARAVSLISGWAAQGMDRGRRGMRRGWNGPDDRLGSDEALSVEELVQLIQVRPWGSTCSAGGAR